MGLPDFGSAGNATAYRIHGVHWCVLHQLLFCGRISEQHNLGQRGQDSQKTKVNTELALRRTNFEHFYLLTILCQHISVVLWPNHRENETENKHCYQCHKLSEAIY